MRQPPKLSEFHRYPVVAGTSLLAIGVTVAWWLKADISPLVVDATVRRGELWRLVTTIFPHGGILHLAFNVYWVWVFGTLLEEVYGHLRTGALILLFAVASSAWEFALLVGGIGLSGVGYGLFGLLWMLSRRDERFHDAVDPRTVQLFIGWFFFCIITTVMNVFPVANIAHGVGALTGILVGLAITIPDNRALSMAGVGTVLVVGFWAATLGRPRVNLSGKAGYEEGKWGYEALLANKNDAAIRWFRDATAYQPKTALYWYNLGIAYARSGNIGEAVASYRSAADLGYPHAEYILATLYESGDKSLPKNSTQALYWYRKLAQQNDPESLNDVAWAYATSPDPAIHDAGNALKLAQRAVDLGKDHPVAAHLDTLAEAYYASGDYESAVKTETQAIALVSNEKKAYYEKQLKKYQDALNDHRRSRAK